MPEINILPPHIAELIAAGEVVEKPMSVVKELLENSIDAGAKKITVEIKNGGIRYIRVTDDGCGISRSDIRKAFISHATSKIKTGEDLDRIMTLGFRGEALASIAAVSKVEILTKTREEGIGTRYVIEGGKEMLCDDAGCPDGTTFMLRELFYNTPARMKFLKKDVTEGNYVTDAVTKIAMSHPGISIKLIRDNKMTLHTDGGGNLRSAIYAVCGREFADTLIDCSYELNGIKINGFVSKPEAGRATRNMQYFFVNGRYVRLPVAASALDNAYKNSIMVGKFPSCVLFAEMSPESVDVNVHPAKTEVRFADDKKVYEAIYYAVTSALQKENEASVIVGASVNNADRLLKIKPKSEQIEMEQVKNREAESRPAMIKTPLPESVPFAKKPVLDIAVDDEYMPPVKQTPQKQAAMHDPSEIDYSSDDDDGLSLESLMTKTEKPKQESSVKPEEAPPPVIADAPPFRVAGEIFNTYIIVEIEGKILFIDKHAAHERIIYNRLREQQGRPVSQLLLMPVTVRLSADCYAAVTENIALFEKAGYGISDYGNGCIAVRECPVDLSDTDMGDVIEEIASKLNGQSKLPEPEKLEWLYHSTACRAAIKAGDDITETESYELAKAVLSDPQVRYCPHGRPVIVEMTKYQIEKMFGRIQ